MIILSVNNLSLAFGTTVILENISFSINEGDRLGIIGVNGAGKTTLFKLISGETAADTGAVYISKDKSVGILSQNASLEGNEHGESAIEHMYLAFPELIAAEDNLRELEKTLSEYPDKQSPEFVNITAKFSDLTTDYTRGGGLEFRGRCKSILARMGFDEVEMKLPISSLSGGQRTRLALARLLAREPDILMLDEPTNHLDIETLTWLENFLSAYKKTVLIISHDRYFLDRITNKTLHIERHTARLYNGNYSASQSQREETREADMKRYNLQQKEIKRVEAMIDQQRRWGQEHNFVTIRAKEKYLEHMDKVERPEDELKTIRMSFKSAPSGGGEVVIADKLSMRFYGKELFSDISFLIKKGERVFFAGPNGCGKSTLMKLIIGMQEKSGGSIELGYNIKAGYYDQENQNLDENMSVLDELWNAYPNLTEYNIRSTLALFLFGYEDTQKLVRDLSGGERARLTLAKLILSKVNLLILDEPTNHLDIPSREALEFALSSFDGTIVCVSHDRYFIAKLASRIIEILPPSSPLSLFDFSPAKDDENIFEAYRAARELVLSEDAAKKNAADEKPKNSKDEYLKKKRDIAEERKTKKQMEAYRAEIAQLETELAKVTDELFGDAASDYIRAAELYDRKAVIEDRLLQLYELTE